MKVNNMRVLRSLGRLQWSPEHAFIPVHTCTQIRPRTRSMMTIWNMPEEVIVHLFKGMHVQDLLNMRAVHPYFRDLIDSTSLLWMQTSFKDLWPSGANIKHFESASEHGNVEATVKLGIAYLYNEGLPGDLEGRRINSNGDKAAQMFCRVERLTQNAAPFTWLFVRPPWSMSGACCKECVFNCMRKTLEQSEDPCIQLCTAKILQLFDDDVKQAECRALLQRAAQLGSTHASYLLWEQTYSKMVCDRTVELHKVRELREIAKSGDIDAQLALCKLYATGKYGGLSQEQSDSFVRKFVQSSKPSLVNHVFKNNSELTPSMRYILIDWLVEVAGMKDFSSHTLHTTVNIVDRYLRIHRTTRTKLQLVGVAAMVICSRYMGRDIITIREAAWLTDNTYKYEDVVRMMGEITGALKGNFKILTSLDFVEIFATKWSFDAKTRSLAAYICELSLLQAQMGRFTTAEIAASSVMLAKLLLGGDQLWTQHMELFTGFSVSSLHDCVRNLHQKCFLEGSVVDHRDITLQAVKQRYSDEKYYKVGETPMISCEDLCNILGICDEPADQSEARRRLRKTEDLIKSPSRSRCPSGCTSFEGRARAKAATPTLDCVDDSALSGYEGDEEHSFLEYDEDENPMLHSDCPWNLQSHIAAEEDTYFASLTASMAMEQQNTLLNYSFTEQLQHVSPLLFGAFDNIDDLAEKLASTSSGVSSSPISSKDGLSTALCSTSNSPQACVYPDFSESESSDSDVFTYSPTKLQSLSMTARIFTTKKSLKRKSKQQIGNASKAFIMP